jgi:hypothetical protein
VLEQIGADTVQPISLSTVNASETAESPDVDGIVPKMRMPKPARDVSEVATLQDSDGHTAEGGAEQTADIIAAVARSIIGELRPDREAEDIHTHRISMTIRLMSSCRCKKCKRRGHQL